MGRVTKVQIVEIRNETNPFITEWTFCVEYKRAGSDYTVPYWCNASDELEALKTFMINHPDFEIVGDDDERTQTQSAEGSTGECV